MVQHVTTTITDEFHKLAQDHKIKWSDALHIGVAVILAEKNIIPYDNRLNLYRRMSLYQSRLGEIVQKLYALEGKDSIEKKEISKILQAFNKEKKQEEKAE